MPYIKKPEAIQKMKTAEENFCPVVILAHAGWGKTSLIESYYKRRNYLSLTGIDGRLDSMPGIDKIRQGVVVIDDVSWIDDPESQKYIVELIKDNNRQVVLAGRGRFPKWLESLSHQVEFVQINYKDLAMSKDDLHRMFKEEGIILNVENVNLLMETTIGYPPALRICLRHCLNGEPISRGTITRAKTELFNYYDDTFFSRISEEARQFLMEVCELKSFDVEVSEALVGEDRANNLIDYCERVGSFLEKTSAKTWSIIEDVREFIRWKRSMKWSVEERLENNRRIAEWFEKKGRLAESADFYENVGNLEKIWELMIKNSHMHPGIGQYHVLRRHYEKLPDEIVIRDPALITGLSLLKSMTMRPEESERWYRELEQFEKNDNNSPDKRKDAKAFLCYLDIGLPHRAGKGMIRSMKSALKLITEKNIELPEFSVTDNIPSVLDGGLDYSEWASNADRIMKFMGPVLEKILGRHGKGLKKIGVAEVGFERHTMEAHEVIRLANSGIAEAAGAGSTEICFAGHGVLIYQYLVMGNVREARACLDSFVEKVEKNEELQFMPNIKATDALIALYESDYDKIRKWLAEAPDAHRDFSIMDRFIYQVKIQCLIAIDNLTEAASLSAYMDWYYREYDRTFSRIENELFTAIIYYRQGISEWKRMMAEVLVGAEKYNYVQLIGMKGVAVLPLLTELDRNPVSDSFLKEVISCSREVAMRYPELMKYASKDIPHLTAREEEVLELLCAGEAMEDICRFMDISYSGLKKHNRNIYNKLGAKNRTDAERIATSMGLVRRVVT